jgi:hypothetical protein
MRRRDPERIRLAQRAGFVARLASARGITRVQAEAVTVLEDELERDAI